MDDVDKEYQVKAKALIKSQMALQSLNFDDLAVKLSELGVEESAKNLSNKIGRGSFSAGFFLQCLGALGVEELRLR